MKESPRLVPSPSVTADYVTVRKRPAANPVTGRLRMDGRFSSIVLVTAYILDSLRMLTAPWRFFQINAHHFSQHKGIYSKLAIDHMIPPKWRLQQCPMADGYLPPSYPVFVKPEWGENGQGVVRADNQEQYQQIVNSLVHADRQHIVQQAAPGAREFELYTVYDRSDKPLIVTVTEAVNDAHRYPVNSIKNGSTRYLDITGQFSSEQLDQLASFKREIGKFGVSRVCLRANSIGDLLAGTFHVVELNLFTPMPINLMDMRYSLGRQLRFIGRVAHALALATRALDDERCTGPVFSRMMMYSHRRKTDRITSRLHEKTEKTAVRRDHQKVHGGLQ